MQARAGLLLLGVLAWGCGGASDDAPPQPSLAPFRAKPSPGRLVLIGGETSSPDPEIYQAILRGRLGDGPICVFPTASSAPTSVMESTRSILDAQGGTGTASTVFLAQEDAERARDPQIGVEISRCSGFFFTSGSQTRLLDVLLPRGDTTLALRAILSRYRAGAVVAATGASVMALGRVAIAGGDSPGAISEGVTTTEGSDGLFLRRGLGILDRAIIDPSFFSEGRIGRLLVAVLATDSVPVGLGVDENTALVVDGDSAGVVGRSGVAILDGRGAVKIGLRFGRGVRVVLAGAGDRVDLRSLEVTPASDKTPLQGGARKRRVRDPFARWGFLHVIGRLAASDSTEARFTMSGATLTLREADGFSAVGRSSEGVQGEPAGLSAGPFVLDLLPVRR